MAQALYHAYSASFTMSAASTTLPAFVIAQTDALHAMQLKKYRVAMAGTGGASVQVTIAATAAAAAAGTTSAGTITQVAGRTVTAGGITVCGYNYTAARTTETYIIVDEFYMPNNGTVIYDYPPGDEPDTGIGVATFGSGFAAFFALGTPVAATIDMWVSRI
jgi:hypothetical protein